jgi:hypothetical protein
LFGSVWMTSAAHYCYTHTLGFEIKITGKRCTQSHHHPLTVWRHAFRMWDGVFFLFLFIFRVVVVVGQGKLNDGHSSRFLFTLGARAPDCVCVCPVCQPKTRTGIGHKNSWRKLRKTIWKFPTLGNDPFKVSRRFDFSKIKHLFDF